MKGPPVRRSAELNLEAHVQRVARELRVAARAGAFNGRDDNAWRVYRQRCTVIDVRTGAVLIFTRDEGMHSSGWFKNPEYERCWHLSLSPLAGAMLVGPLGEPLSTPDLDRALTRRWVSAIFEGELSALWAESPKSPEGIARGVWHWRQFVDPHWRPIVPREEVYSLELTELGWRSASQVLEEDRRLVTSVLNPE